MDDLQYNHPYIHNLYCTFLIRVEWFLYYNQVPIWNMEYF